MSCRVLLASNISALYPDVVPGDPASEQHVTDSVIKDFCEFVLQRCVLAIT